MLRALVTNLSVLTIICLLLFVLTFWILWRTSFGLRLRSCGESPAAAESLGINVIRYKFVAVLISGGLAGLGGGFLALVASSTFREVQTGGRGYIGLAAMIFGNWRPGGLLAGAGLFGYTDTLRLRGGGESIHGLLLLVAVGLVLIAIWQLRKARKVAGAVTLGIGVLIGLWYFFIDSIPRGPHRHDPVRHDAAGARVLLSTPTNARGRRQALPQGQCWLMVDVGTLGIKGADDPVDWDALDRYATEVMGRAYAPYSNFKVGVAGLVDDGRVVLGCNVENAAYGVALCAECGMVSALHATGGGRLIAVACVDSHGKPLMPCGRCRQLLVRTAAPTCS